MNPVVRDDTSSDKNETLPFQRAIGEILSKTPEWVRQDIGSKDQQARARAEETLAAIIGAALSDRLRA